MSPLWISNFFSKSTVANKRSYLCPVDYFHDSYPQSPLHIFPDWETSEAILNRDDRISKLPIEIFEQIMLYLPLDSLDSARVTCKRWWQMIMTNRLILESCMKKSMSETAYSFLDRFPPQELSPLAQLRRLARAFDKDAIQHSFSNIDQTHRLRYRKISSQFAAPTDCGLRTLDVHFAEGLQAGALLCSAPAGSSSTRKEVYFVLIYEFEPIGQPKLITSLRIDKVGVPDKIRLVGARFMKRWDLQIRVQAPVTDSRSLPDDTDSGDGQASHNIPQGSFEYYSHTLQQSRYKPPNMRPSAPNWIKDSVASRSAKLDLLSEIRDLDCGGWVLLQSIPLFEKCEDLPSPSIRALWVAQKRDSGDLFFVRTNPAINMQGCTKAIDVNTASTAVYPLFELRKPAPGSLFKNLAVAYTYDGFVPNYQTQISTCVHWLDAARKGRQGVLYKYQMDLRRKLVESESKKLPRGFSSDQFFDIVPQALGSWEPAPCGGLKCPDECVAKCSANQRRVPEKPMNMPNPNIKDSIASEMTSAIISSSPSISDIDVPYFIAPRSPHIVQGKRIASVPSHLGANFRSQMSHGTEGEQSLGGMTLYGADGRAVLIWGLAPDQQRNEQQNRLDVVAFNFRPVSSLTHSYTVQYADDLLDSSHFPHQRMMNPPLFSPPCLCKLSDSEYVVKYPGWLSNPRTQTGLRASSMVPSVWPLSNSSLKRNEMIYGSVTEELTGERGAAMSRREEGLKVYNDIVKARLSVGFGYDANPPEDQNRQIEESVRFRQVVRNCGFVRSFWKVIGR